MINRMMRPGVAPLATLAAVATLAALSVWDYDWRRIKLPFWVIHMNALNSQFDPSQSHLHEAVARSVAIIKQAKVREPEAMNATLVVPAEEDASAWFAKMRWLVLRRLGLGLLLMAGGALAVFLLWGPTSQGTQGGSSAPLTMHLMIVAVGAVMFLPGLVMVATLASTLARRTRKAMIEKMNLWQDVMPDAPQMCVNLEDAASFDKLKVLADDYAVAWFDVDGQRVIIEGLRHRYFILREDVMAMRVVTQAGSSGVEVTFLVKPDCLVKVVVIGSSTREEIIKQVGGQVSQGGELADHLRSALDWPDPEKL